MKFLILFLALVLQQQLPAARGDKARRWFAGIWSAAAGRPWLGHSALAMFGFLVLLPVLVLSAAFWWLESILWGLPALVAEVVLLLLLLSSANIGSRLRRYRECLRSKDVEAAWLCAEESIALPQAMVSDDPESMNRQVLQAVLHRWFEYFFLIVFWYVLAGVGGALLAWLTLNFVQAVARQESVAENKDADTDSPAPMTKAVDHRFAVQALFWLEWAPARLLALTYCLAGNMASALPVWKSVFWKTAMPAASVLNRTAMASLGTGDSHQHGHHDEHWHSIASDADAAANELDEWHQLHWRSGSIWLVAIAIATIGGWML